MTRYYCSGFDINNAFGHGLGDMFLNELKDRKSIVYIPGGADKMQKVREIYVPAFTEHFKNVGIEFETSTIITPDMSPAEAQKAVSEASFVMLMGGDPFKQKNLCDKLGLLEVLKKDSTTQPLAYCYVQTILQLHHVVKSIQNFTLKKV